MRASFICALIFSKVPRMRTEACIWKNRTVSVSVPLAKRLSALPTGCRPCRPAVDPADLGLTKGRILWYTGLNQLYINNRLNNRKRKDVP